MPSTRHELLVALVRETASRFLPLVVPPEQARTAWWDQNANLTLPDPVERRADLLLLDDPVEPTYGVIVEIQLQWDDQKLFTFPLYQMAARDRFRCPIQAVLVTPSVSVADKFSRPIPLGGGWEWQPSVFGPDEAWALLTASRPDDVSPDLLLLLAGVAGRHDDGRIARALFSAATAVDSAVQPDYIEWALGALSRAGASVFQELLMNAKSNTDPWTYQNPLFRWLLEVGWNDGREDGREEGREEGLEAGRTALLEVGAMICSPERYAELERLDDLGALRDAIADAAAAMRAGK